MVVTIAVPDYTALFERVSEPALQSTLAEFVFEEGEEPISAVTIILNSDGRDYSLETRIDGPDMADQLVAARSSISDLYSLSYSALDLLTGKRTAVPNDQYFLVKHPETEKLTADEELLQAVLGIKEGRGNIEVRQAFGSLWVLAGAGMIPITPLLRVSTPQRFFEDFGFFSRTTEAAINGIYKNYGSGIIPDWRIEIGVIKLST